MADNPSALWIDWGRKLRSRTLAQRLDVELVEIRIGGNRVWRYLRSIRRTVRAIRRARPRVVIATNPSLVLGLLLLTLRRWYGFVLVSDAHYVGVRSLHGRRLMQSVLDFHNTRVDLVIVTNEGQAQYVAGLGGRAYVCPDPLPDLRGRVAARVVPEKSVFLVSSFEQDEPYEAAFSAFSRSQLAGFTLFVSGNYRRANVDPARVPWVRFLGYVSEDDYYAYLGSCAVTLDLTTLEDCLLCGAYEALAAGKPLVISNTRALANYFGAAAILTDNTPEAISERVERAYAQRADLTQKTAHWAVRNEVYMSERIAALKDKLRVLSGLS
jgi:glycosyltransferase involved in cell wall biosynthesis